MRKNRTRAMALIAIVGFLAGCAGSGDGGTTQRATNTEQTSVEPTSTQVDQNSPIEQLLGVPVFDDAAMNTWFRELDVERQRHTAECMLAAGFIYHQELAPSRTASGSELDTATREYAEVNGFGITNAFNEAEYDPTKDYSTENSKYVASLSAAERDAYDLALYGSETKGDLDDDFDDDFPGAGGGCEGAAFDEVFAILGVLDQLAPVADGYFDALASDSRRIALVEDYQRCMSESGFAVSDPEEVREQFYIRLDTITSSDAAFEPDTVPDGLPEPEFVLNGDVYGFHPKLTEPAQVKLDQLLNDEIATAIAHFDCRAPLIDDELAIQREYEADLAAEIGPAVAEALGGS